MAITIFQAEIFTSFILPFLLMFFVVFAILEKTEIFGQGKGKINAMTAFVIGLIFVSAVSPKLVVENLILFLTVALILVFVVMLIWGFVVGDELKIEKGPKWIIGGIVFIVALFALFSALNVQVFDILFKQEWSQTFFTNLIFLVVVAIALAIALKSGGIAAKVESN